MSYREPLIWTCKVPIKEKLIGIYNRERGPDRFLFVRGQPIYGDLPKPVFDYSEATLGELRKQRCLCNDALIPLVDKGLADLIAEMSGHEVQFIESDVITADGATAEFKLVNALKVVDCIDYERSEPVRVKDMPQVIIGFRNFTLKCENIGQASFFRAHERTTVLFVSARARDVLLSTGAPGLYFATAHEVYPPRRDAGR